MIIVAFHEIAQAILTNHDLIAGQHRRHNGQLQAQLALLDLKVAICYVTSLFVANIEAHRSATKSPP